MASYTVKATITVSGDGIRSKQDVKNALFVMLNDYADMNEDAADVGIHLETVARNSF